MKLAASGQKLNRHGSMWNSRLPSGAAYMATQPSDIGGDDNGAAVAFAQPSDIDNNDA